MFEKKGCRRPGSFFGFSGGSFVGSTLCFSRTGWTSGAFFRGVFTGRAGGDVFLAGAGFRFFDNSRSNARNISFLCSSTRFSSSILSWIICVLSSSFSAVISYMSII